MLLCFSSDGFRCKYGPFFLSFLPSEDPDFVLQRVLLPLESLFIDEFDGVQRSRIVLALRESDLGEGTPKKDEEKSEIRWGKKEFGAFSAGFSPFPTDRD